MLQLEALLDPERRKKATEDQAKLRELKGPRVARHAAQSKFMYGMARESSALHQLGGAQVDAAVASVQAGTASAATERLVDQLAEGLALQARYDLALLILPEGPRREDYQAKQTAIDHVNERQCDDPITQKLESGKLEATQVVREQVWNGKLIIKFVECVLCRAISAYA